MRISLQDIATHLGLNRSTVSRALRNDPRIPIKTKERVEIACKELDYRPNPLISELAAARWHSPKSMKSMDIGYIIRMRQGMRVGLELEPFVREQASALGYNVKTFRRVDFSSSAKLEKALRNQGITDVILGPVFEEHLTVELDWSKFICIQVQPDFFPLPLHSVLQNQFDTVLMAWKKAVEYGYKRIGIELIEHPMRVMDDFLRASAVHVCQTGLFPLLHAIPPFYHPPGDMRIKEFAKWVKKNNPDVIIGFSPSHFYFYRDEFHRNTPFICLHGSDLDIAGIYPSTPSCGREAVNFLQFCHRTFQWGIPKERIDHVIEPTWHDGASLPKRT